MRLLLQIQTHSSGRVLWCYQVTAQTPDFAVGSKDSIRLKPKSAAAAAPAAASKAANAWLLAGDDLDGDELMDDEDLLTEEDRQRPAGACSSRPWCGYCVLI